MSLSMLQRFWKSEILSTVVNTFYSFIFASIGHIFRIFFFEASIFKSYPGEVPGFMGLETCTAGDGCLL